MSSTPACDVCGAPALARVGGVPFCAPCALTIDPDGPIPRRSVFRRWEKPAGAAGVVAMLLVSGVALAAFWPSAPAVPGGDAGGSSVVMAAPNHDVSPYMEGEPSALSVVAQGYASAVAAWADCVSAASGEGMDASLVLERCSSLRPDPLDDTGFGTGAPPPVLTMQSSGASMGHEIEGLDLPTVRSATDSGPSNEAAPPGDPVPPSDQPDSASNGDARPTPHVEDLPDDPVDADDDGDSSIPPASDPDDGSGDDLVPPGDDDDDDDDQGGDDDDD